MSGNRAGFRLWVFGLFLVACAAPKPAVRPHAGPSRPDQPETTREYDPATDTYVTKPVNPEVDTIRWTRENKPPAVADPVPAESDNADPSVTSGALDDFPATVNVTIALPVESLSPGQKPDLKQSRFLQYYAGLRMALEETDALRRNIKLHVVDAGQLSLQADRADNDHLPNLLIGPYDRDTLEAWLEAGAGRNMLVISPWLPAFTPKTSQPGLIQLSPGLERHAEAIMAYVRTEMPGQRIVLVARNDPAEKSRLSLFRKHGDDGVREMIVTDKSRGLEATSLSGYLADAGTVFILPFYSRQDETFVNAFMGKLQAEKGDRPVTVFGLPQWTGFANLNTGYMEGLSLHLSQPAWQMADPEVLKQFRDKFFARHHTVPDINAMQGYDLGLWLVETLEKSGKRGFTDMARAWTDGICSGFDIRAVHPPDNTAGDVLYYENASIRIIRFQDQDFVWVR